MDTTNNKGAPSHGTPSTLQSDSNSAQAQRQRLLARLRLGALSTIEARRDLDIMMPASRVHELRHREGYDIQTLRHNEETDCGKKHNVAVYVLQVGEVCHE
jgi:hypothetical protein